MAIQFSTTARNGMLDSLETSYGVSARLRLYTGAPPANCAAAATGTLIAEYALASDWAAAASAGSKGLNNLPLSTTASAGGTIGYYRFVDSAGTTCHEQGTVTASGGGGDMTIDNATVTTGQTIQVTAFSKVAPGA